MAGEWSYSQPFLARLKATEGWEPRPKWDYQQYSIGYGTRAQPGDFAPGFRLSPEEGEQRMTAELDKARAAVQARFPNLNPSQVEGLTSFTYNLGPKWMSGSNVAAAVDRGDFAGAQQAMQQWDHAGGTRNKGLTSRRGWEGAMLTGGGNDPIGSMFAYNAQPNGAPDQIAAQISGGGAPSRSLMRLGAPPPQSVGPQKGGSLNGGMGMDPMGGAGHAGMVDETNAGRQSLPTATFQGVGAPSGAMITDFGRQSSPGQNNVPPPSLSPAPGGGGAPARPVGPPQDDWAKVMQQQMMSGTPALQGTLHGPVDKASPQYKNTLISMLGGLF